MINEVIPLRDGTVQKCSSKNKKYTECLQYIVTIYAYIHMHNDFQLRWS